METIPQSKLVFPDGYDHTLEPELILVIPLCRMRDERNMQLLFASHWVSGEWFAWSSAFERQMRGMTFVTHAARLKYLAEVRRAYGGYSHTKEERWGMQPPELLAHLAEWRALQSLPAAVTTDPLPSSGPLTRRQGPQTDPGSQHRFDPAS